MENTIDVGLILDNIGDAARFYSHDVKNIKWAIETIEKELDKLKEFVENQPT